MDRTATLLLTVLVVVTAACPTAPLDGDPDAGPGLEDDEAEPWDDGSDDAGSSPGPDGGLDPEPDAGVDPEPDAGQPPVPDAGPLPDPNPLPDAGPLPGPDAGPFDAGQQPGLDAGPGPEPEPDAGPGPEPDAGPEPEADAGPEPEPGFILTGTGERPEVVRLTLHSSEALLARNGRVSEAMVAMFIAEALADAGYGYEIVYDLPAEAPPDEAAVCGGGEAFSWWQQRINGDDETLVRRKDANLLLLDVNGGGCGAVTGWVATTPARNIDEERAWTSHGADPWHRNIHANLHELGHNLGMRHDHDPDTPGAQHRGQGWNGPDPETGLDAWHRTPSVAGNGAPNDCGADIEEKAHNKVVRHQLYNACASDSFHVKPEPGE